MNLVNKNKIWAIVIVLLSLVLAIFIERCFGSPKLFKSAYYELQDSQNQQLEINDFHVHGYQIEGNKIVSTSDQDNYLLYNDINRKVGTIAVYFAQPLPQDMSASLYYTRDNIQFNENMRIRAQGKQGDLILVFVVNSPVQDFRLDLGEKMGYSFEFGRVSINEPWRSIKEMIKGSLKPMALSRSSLLFVLWIFIGLHFLLDIKKMYNIMFRYRYVVAAALLLFLAIQQYHGSSIGMYNNIIQQNQGSEYVVPVLGEARGIRSDEWAVSTPWKLASACGEHPFGEYNYIMRATKTVNLGTSGLYLSYASLANPFLIFIYVFGIAGFGAFWYSMLILCFMVSFEMCLIICERRKLFALTGAFLITFSAYFQWWSYVLWVIYGQAILVCCYYFFTTNKAWKRVLLSIGIGLSGTAYVCSLYPPWIVPAAYLLAGIFMWMLIENREYIKKFKFNEWSIFAIGIVFGISIILAYFTADKEYLEAVTQTVYPGARASQGGLSLPLIFNYFKTPLYPYINPTNASEGSTFLSMYPIATVMGLYIWFKSKKKDLLLTILLGYSVFLTLYVTVGIPMFIAKITLMSYSTAERAINILDFMQIYLLLMVMTRYENVPKMPVAAGIVISVGSVALAVWFACNSEPGYIPIWYIVIASIVFACICYCIISKVSEKMKSIICFTLISISILTGLVVNPLQKGFDVIYSKPVAKEIMRIVEKDNTSKWIALDQLSLPGFLISCGAPTVNSVNNYPNLDLWAILDPEGKYNEVYNRYAHIEVALTENESYPELVQADYIRLYLNYQDLHRIGIKYIFVQHPLEKKQDVNFSLIYNENCCYIYKLFN
jgi:hypothetical protein